MNSWSPIGAKRLSCESLVLIFFRQAHDRKPVTVVSLIGHYMYSSMYKR